MVDSAFLEWDKASMFKHLHQLETATGNAGRRFAFAVDAVSLQANSALLLALVIIPTLNGVALIA